MGILDYALHHARQGRLVFPGVPNSKMPALVDPYYHATTDEKTIRDWWSKNPNQNICLPGGYEVSKGKYLGFIDVDVKKGKNGLLTIEKLSLLDFEFPETLTQVTPSGGLHLFYFFNSPIPNSVGLLGEGLDTRGYHGYVVGAGSEIDGREYTFKNEAEIAQAPEWVVERCLRPNGDAKSKVRQLGQLQLIHSVDQNTAERKAMEYLATLGGAREGERNHKAFVAACKIKDFGCSQDRTVELLVTSWKCEPALEREEIVHVVNSAFNYGQNSPGVDAPEMIFDAIPSSPQESLPKPRHPIDVMNEEYAFVTAGGGVRIIWETKNHEDKDRVEHLSIESFHYKNANKLVTYEDKAVPVSKIWLKSKKRREYEGIIFAPNYTNPNFFNVWRGFSVGLPKGDPTPDAQRSVDYILEHIRENVCGGNPEWARWVIGFFAHIVQFPERKPTVALVLRGKKGVGKNVITECVGRLLGNHYILAANRRYLSGNFNSHLENKLLLVLDEAYWSGDKASEGILKDLITGSTQQIERKGHDSYTVANLMRIVIFGNEEWLVPASEDERRFAVFNVGNARQRDRKFFGAIMDGMRNHGGDELLFKYLKEFDLSTVDLDDAPQTDALMDQKEESLDPVKAWWLACLKAGYIIGSSNHEWPGEMVTDVFRNAFYEQCKDQNIKSRLPNETHLGRLFKRMSPLTRKHRASGDSGVRYYIYHMAPLDQARIEFEGFMGGKIEWDQDAADS